MAPGSGRGSSRRSAPAPSRSSTLEYLLRRRDGAAARARARMAARSSSRYTNCSPRPACPRLTCWSVTRSAASMRTCSRGCSRRGGRLRAAGCHASPGLAAAAPARTESAARAKPPAAAAAGTLPLQRPFRVGPDRGDGAASRSLRLVPPIPLAVVSGGRAPPSALLPPAALRAKRSQQRMARLSPLGQQEIAARSGHFPQVTEPRLVLQMLRRIGAQIGV